MKQRLPAAWNLQSYIELCGRGEYRRVTAGIQIEHSVRFWIPKMRKPYWKTTIKKEPRVCKQRFPYETSERKEDEEGKEKKTITQSNME